MTDVATDELTAEEEAILRSDTTPPQSAEEEVVTTPKEGEQTEDPPKTAETEKKDGETETKPEGEGQKTEAEADPDADFKAFSEKHKDKSAEEILKLAFQQGKARTAARMEASEATKAVHAMRDGLAKRAEAARARHAQEREKFEETLRNDPDAAARMSLERSQQQELNEIQARDWDRYIEQQTHLAASVIPSFDTNAGEMARFGVEALGFTNDEVRAIDDARQLVGLYMAMQYSNMIARGVVDMSGNILTQPGQAQGQQEQQIDPRLKTPEAPKTLSAAAGGVGGAVKGIRAQVAEALAMADKDFDSLPGDQLEAMLREVSGAGR